MKLIPLYDETAPIACTITTDEIPDRIDLIERMRSNLTSVRRTEHGLVLAFPNRPDTEADLQKFVVDEKRCCQFWGFEMVSGDEAVALRWDGPPSSNEILDRLEEFLTGDEPASALAGLL